MAIMRAAVLAELTPLADDEVEVIISTSALARDGHVLEPTGCDLTNSRANPVVLWQHNPDQPVGLPLASAMLAATLRCMSAIEAGSLAQRAPRKRWAWATCTVEHR